MIRYLTLSALLFFVFSCNQHSNKQGSGKNDENNGVVRLYSSNVNDTFSIFTSLPEDYDPHQHYPVVYLLDANIYFDIMSAAIHKYAEIGLAPQVILVGIGYKDFPSLDSLRNRDDTYPVAIPEYEMAVSGGADKFLAFISHELIPYVDKKYETDTTKRILMGHSLGGYFTTYTLLQNLSSTNNSFSGYIAASPSIHYNKYYLVEKLKELPQQKNRDHKLSIYLTYGGAEDDENKDDSTMMKSVVVSQRLNELLSGKQSGSIIYKSDIYSNLGHMDMPIPTFMKGLQWIFNNEK